MPRFESSTPSHRSASPRRGASPIRAACPRGADPLARPAWVEWRRTRGPLPAWGADSGREAWCGWGAGSGRGPGSWPGSRRLGWGAWWGPGKRPAAALRSGRGQHSQPGSGPPPGGRSPGESPPTGPASRPELPQVRATGRAGAPVTENQVCPSTGSDIKKVLPCPSRLSAQTRPPCRSTIDLTIASPSPEPLMLMVSRCLTR